MVWTEWSGVVDLVRTENIARGPFGCLLALWLPAAAMRSAGGWTGGLCVLCACTLSRCAAQLVDLWCHRASPQAEIVAVAAAVEDVKNLNIPSPTAAVVLGGIQKLKLKFTLEYCLKDHTYTGLG